MAEKEYTDKEIKFLEKIGEVRANFDVIELSNKIKRQGDIIILSRELRIKPRALSAAIKEGRVLKLLPKLDKSKLSIISALRTDREVKLFSQQYDLRIISARKLIKLVKLWNNELQNNPLKLITQEEHDLIMGSLMGDANIRQREKNSCFRVDHSLKQKKYIQTKLDILSNFNISELNQTCKVINGRTVDMIHLSTDTHPVFNYYRNLFYGSGKKKIIKGILDQINPRSLAIWICDDGSYHRRQGYIILCTNSYSLEDHQLMKEFFKEKFNLDPTIGFRDGKYYYLRFKQADTKKLIEIIKEFIPKSMLYKIGGENE